MGLGGGYVPEGLGRTGAALFATSVAVLAFLFGSAIASIMIGSEHWRRFANPDPFGMFSGLFFVTTTGLLLAGIAGTFILLSYAGEYRRTTTVEERGRAGQRWLGAIYGFTGVPFLILSFLVFGDVGKLLFLTAFLPIGIGAAYFVGAYRSANRPTVRPGIPPEG